MQQVRKVKKRFSPSSFIATILQYPAGLVRRLTPQEEPIMKFPLSPVQTSLALAAALLAIQLIPYGRNRTNPPVVQEPVWDSPATRALAKRACFDCHSNETVWPWYSRVAPVSWLIRHDVDEGREEMNFSRWENKGETDRLAGKVRSEVSKGAMPPIQYRAGHPEARLTDAEKQQLIEGLTRTLTKK